jgi:hypothetical protein
MHLARICLTLIGVPLFGYGVSQVHAQEPELVRRAQDASLSTLEPNAANVTLAQWLSRLGGGSPGSVEWEVNDCGEGGDGRQSPVCVEGRVTIGTGLVASVSVIVVALSGQPVSPSSIWMMYVSDGQRVELAKTTGELESLIDQRRR